LWVQKRRITCKIALKKFISIHSLCEHS